MHWISYCRKARKGLFSNKYQLPCEIRFDSNVNGLFGQVLSILCVYICVCICVCVTPVALYLHWGPKTTSPAGSQPQVLLEIKQEISALWNKHTQVSHIFWLTSLLPAAASNHFGFFAHFLKKKKKISHSNFKIGKYQTSPSYWCHRDFRARHWLARSIHIYLENHDNRSKKKKKERKNGK